jgi:hypothetical protein
MGPKSACHLEACTSERSPQIANRLNVAEAVDGIVEQPY